jgi:hypothetical protein
MPRQPFTGRSFQISIPAFSEDGSHEIAYCGHHWGLLGAHDHMAFLERVGAEWETVLIEQIWIS